MVQGGVKCVKWLLFVFNLLFFLSGCALIAVGVWLNIERDDWEGVSKFDYISVANVVMAAGAIIIVFAFLGCCGAITESKCMLLIFFVFLLIIFIMEIGTGIAAYVMRGEVKDELRKQLEERIPSRFYKEDGIFSAMNSIQRHFDCCGVNNITDWKKPSQNRDGNPVAEVQSSCCIDDRSNAGYSSACGTLPYTNAVSHITRYNTKGCYKSIEDFIEDNLLYVGITGVVFAIFQIVGMVFTMVLYCALRRDSQIA